MPLLEKHRIKYCIHHRDFEVGKAILENIADSVYNSKKVAHDIICLLGKYVNYENLVLHLHQGSHCDGPIPRSDCDKNKFTIIMSPMITSRGSLE